jgi:hypothetical protein
MLTYSQRLFMGHYRGVYAVNWIFKIIDKCGKVLMSQFSPEDTTDNDGEAHLQNSKREVYNISGIIKAVFWVAISISIALQIGRLS